MRARALLLWVTFAGCSPVTVVNDAGSDLDASTPRDAGVVQLEPDTFSFATTEIFGQRCQRFVAKNAANAMVTVRSITVALPDGGATGDFSLDAGTPVLAPADQYEFVVCFSPQSGAKVSARVVVRSDAPVASAKVDGTGTPDAGRLDVATVEWQRLMGLSAANDHAAGLALAADGTSWLLTSSDRSISASVFVLRVNAQGAFDWTRRLTDASASGTDALSAVDAGLFAAVSAPDAGLVLSIDALSGTLVWQQRVGGIGLTAVDATGPRVLAAGTQGSSAVVLSFDRATGTLLSAHRLDLPGNHRALTLKRANATSSFLGGENGLFARIDGLDDGAPTVAFTQLLPLGDGGSVDSLDTDDAGNTIAALARVGITSEFSVARFGSDGGLSWAKTWPSGPMNQPRVVRLDGTHALVGGRVGLEPFDTRSGDALLASFSTTQGTLEWSAFHFTGTADERLAGHSVSALASNGRTVVLSLDALPGAQNSSRLLGGWFSAPWKLDNYSPQIQTVDAGLVDAALTAVPAALEWNNSAYRFRPPEEASCEPGDSEVALSRFQTR